MTAPKQELQLLSSVDQQVLNLVGIWRNELDSVMDIRDVRGSMFFGKYTSKVSSKGTEVTGDLLGTVAIDSIGFVVNWEPTYNSITSWAGKILSTKQGSHYIYTLWNLSQGIKSEDDWWQSIKAGSDTFWKVGQ